MKRKGLVPPHVGKHAGSSRTYLISSSDCFSSKALVTSQHETQGGKLKLLMWESMKAL